MLIFRALRWLKSSRLDASRPAGFRFAPALNPLEERTVPVAPPAPPGFTAVATSFTNSTAVAISASGMPVVTSTITVSGVGSFLHDVDLFTTITHTWNNDLDITLTSPAGTVVTITTDNSPGGAVNVFNGTLWDDDADPGGQVPYGLAPNIATDTTYTSNVAKPLLTPEEALGAFRGENPNGVWTLTISDDTNLDGGSLASWRLDLSTFTSAPTFSAPLTFENATATPLLDNGATTSTITVSGASKYVQRVNLRTLLAHTSSQDLDVTLRSPAGTVVTITTDNGATAANVFNGTLWDDYADPLSQVPYTNSVNTVTDTAYLSGIPKPTLTPEEALAAFIGENPNGVWTLTVVDDAPNNTGTLTLWRLTLFGVPNALPVLNAPAALTLNEDATAAVTGITITDGDALDLVTVTVTAPGTLTATGAVISGSGTGTLTATGTPAAVTAALGTLTYTPPPNFNGTTTISVTGIDDQNGSAPARTINVTVNPVPDPPVITAPAVLTLNEDIPTALAVSVADPDAGNTFTVTVATNNGATLAATGAGVGGSGTGTLTVNGTLAAVNAALGTLTYTPPLNFNGTTGTVTVTATDNQSQSAVPRTVNVTVNAINDAPTIAQPADVTRAEDSGAFTQAGFVTGFSPGPADESGQGLLRYLVSNNNNALFSVQPSVALNGTLTFTPVANAFGTATVTVRAQDNGDIVSGGLDTSAPRTFTITLTEVNDAPVLGNDTLPAVFNGVVTTIPGSAFRTNDTPGPANESAQTLTLTAVAPTTGGGTATISGGDIVYTPAPGFAGTAVLTYTLTDNGTTDGAADPLAATGTITFTVLPPNTAPTFTSHGGAAVVALTVRENARPTLPVLVATTVAAADADVPAQGLTFSLSGPDAARFALAPSGGALTFVSGPDFEAPTDAGGDNVYNVTVTVTDSGNPLLTDTQEFTFTISDVLEPVPVFETAEFIALGTDVGTPAVVRVLNAQTRQQVLLLDPFGGFAGGVQVALGDVNGDGREDLIVGTATGGAHVKVFDVRSGVELSSFMAFPGFAGGVTLAAADVNGDKRADVVVGTATGATHVKAVDALTGAELQSVIAFPGFAGGVKVAAGDLSGDGKAELIVLAGRGGNGHVKVFSGANGALLTSFLAYEGYLGEISLGVGDADGDGFGDLVTAAQTGRGATHLKAFDVRADTVRSFFAPVTAAADFAPLARVAPQAPGSVARIGVSDVNGDKVADYLIGSQPGTTASRFVVIDGMTGANDTRFAFDPLFGFGVFVDLN